MPGFFCSKKFNSQKIEIFYHFKDNSMSVTANGIGAEILNKKKVMALQPDSPPQLNEENIDQILKYAKIDLSEEIQADQTCISLLQNGGHYTWGTLGNFSAVIGKAKSRKSFLISIAIAAALKRSLFDLITVSFAPGKDRVLFFDTEQSRYHVQRSVKRISSLSENENIERLLSYGLRRFSPADRLKLIEHAIYHTPGVGLVVIDGIRDLVTSINDEEQATIITSKLLKWTEERNIHIIIVLHQNKGDGNARGHVGSEIINKAETVISVTKEADQKETSSVQAEYCRDKDFSPFAFEINEHGIPTMKDSWAIKAKEESKRKPSPYDIPVETHLKILRQVFEFEKLLFCSDLELKIISAVQAMGIDLGRNKAGEYRQYYLNQKMIQASKVDGKKYTVYQPL